MSTRNHIPFSAALLGGLDLRALLLLSRL